MTFGLLALKGGGGSTNSGASAALNASLVSALNQANQYGASLNQNANALASQNQQLAILVTQLISTLGSANSNSAGTGSNVYLIGGNGWGGWNPGSWGGAGAWGLPGSWGGAGGWGGPSGWDGTSGFGGMGGWGTPWVTGSVPWLGNWSGGTTGKA